MKSNRMNTWGYLLSTALILCATTFVCAQQAAETASSAKVFQLAEDNVTAMIASSGALSGNAKRHFRSANVVHGFESPQDTVTWTVNVPKDDDYVVDVLFSKREQAKLEVSSGDSVLTAPSIIRTWDYRPFFWRQELPGTLRLKAGKNQITFRVPDAKPVTSSRRSPRFGQGVTEEFHLFSIELGTAAARKAQVERAKAIRGDASWMIEGKYGIFVHWSSQSRGFNINEKRAQWFQKSVDMFDVKVFADAIERTGASWITFTATHQGFYWPAPNAAIDKIAPGRTAKRDLLSEIINELDKRGIRTLFYLHTGYNGYDPKVWREALGANDADTKHFSDNIEAILRECSLRYGEKLMGFGYMDGALAWDYPLNPSWEGWARAIKAGNPKAVVGFSTNRGPAVSPFSELGVTDGGSELRQPDSRLFGPGQQLGDVTPAWWCLMDRGGWFINRPMNGQWGPGPIHSTEEYVDFFKRMAESKIPVTINLLLCADVTDDHPIFNPKCMAVMEAVRKAVHGNQDLRLDGLVLDLNADTGVTIEDGSMVTTWTNQAPNPKAIDFKSTEEGRTKTIISQEELGTGRPTLLKNSSEINGHNSLIFSEDELINDNDEAFHGMMTGSGYTWFAVIKPYKQGGPGKINSRYPNAFFGCLRNSGKPQLETGQYAGFWGSFYPDGRVYMGSRNGLNEKVRDGVNTPEVAGPPPAINEWHIIMGRQGSGQGVVKLELFVDDPSEVINSSDFPVADVEPSRMAIGTERNAINHQGKESFDGELARLLMFETALDQQEMQEVYDYLRRVYFE